MFLALACRPLGFKSLLGTTMDYFQSIGRRLSETLIQIKNIISCSAIGNAVCEMLSICSDLNALYFDWPVSYQTSATLSPVALSLQEIKSLSCLSQVITLDDIKLYKGTLQCDKKCHALYYVEIIVILIMIVVVVMCDIVLFGLPYNNILIHNCKDIATGFKQSNSIMLLWNPFDWWKMKPSAAPATVQAGAATTTAAAITTIIR